MTRTWAVRTQDPLAPGALVCGTQGGAELRTAPLPARRRARRCVRTPVQRHQPRHRAPGLRGPGRRTRVASACAAPMQEGEFPSRSNTAIARSASSRQGPRELRRPDGVLPASAPGSLHAAPADASAPCPTACRRAGPRSPPTWKRRSTRSGMRAPGRATASSWWAPAWSGCSSRYLAARLPGAEVTVVDVDAAAPHVARRSARRSAPPEQRRATPTSSSTPAPPRPGSHCAIACAGFEATIVEMSWYGDKPVQVAARRRLPQPPAEARVVAGRRRSRRRAARAGTIAAASRTAARAARRRPRSTRWSPRRSPSRMLPARAAAHPRARRATGSRTVIRYPQA